MEKMEGMELVQEKSLMNRKSLKKSVWLVWNRSAKNGWRSIADSRDSAAEPTGQEETQRKRTWRKRSPTNRRP